jgi:Glycosyltransferase family 87
MRGLNSPNNLGRMIVNPPLVMPRVCRLVVVLLLTPAALLFALGLAWHIWPAARPYRDLSQDWLSARCFFDSRSIYTRHDQSIPRFLGRPGDDWEIQVNAHPPPSLLMLMPLGLLPHETALLFWNLLSLAMMAIAVWVVLGPWGLNCDSWYRLAAYGLLICSAPLAAQVQYAQLSPLLTLLIALAWTSDRRGRENLAGFFIGLAASVKLFPAFLLLNFLCTRQWKALSMGVGTIIALHALAMLVFGPSDVVHYYRDVVPQVSGGRSCWLNFSLAGFWSRLFDVGVIGTREWFHAPALAKSLTYATSGAITAAVAWSAWKARTIEQRDLAFAAAVIAMLLVSPITWDHNLLLLLLPVSILWCYAANTALFQLLLAALVAVSVFVPSYQLWRIFLGESSTPGLTGVANPWHAVAVLPIVTYCLLAMLVMALAWLGRREAAGNSSATA